jgi:predicted ribosome quality control (RQC) complex YloA/Tae2 family protein
MYKSYFYLNRLTIELNSILVNKKIVSIFSQEKDRLIIQLDDTDPLYIEVSVNHSDPFINIKNKFSRAKKNTVDLFSGLIDKTITNVQIASKDRIIKILTNDGEIYFAIRGKYTNLFFNSASLISFKDETEENLNKFKLEFDSTFFQNQFNIPSLEIVESKSIENIRKQYQFIGREIENEVKARRTNQKKDSELLFNVLEAISIENPAVYSDEKTGEVQIAFNSLYIFSMFEKELFENITTAFNQFLIKRYQYEEKKEKVKKINLFLERELKKCTSRLNNLITVVERGPQDKEYSKIANLLLINLNNIQAGLSEIEIDDIYYSGCKLIVKLDNKLSIKKNADRYFEKARDSKIAFEKSSALYLSTIKEFDKLKEYEKRLENNLTIEDMNKIMKDLKIKDENKIIFSDDLAGKFKHYILDNKYHVYVGKDSLNNDLLTTKFAKQNDFWFHARSVSGSHVVLRVDNTKEAVPKNILKKAASLAAYHSKAKTAGLVPVSYTFKKNVSKRKGMPAGQVSLLKEDVLLVKPEIPSDTEYLV